MNSAQVFTDNWHVYQKIVQQNFMYHQDFQERTAAAWQSMSFSPAEVLDIGCGDASTMLPHLRQHPGTAFTGYDLSAHALELAAVNLSGLSGNTRLQHGDMLELISREPHNFQLIHSSFAIHHLPDEQKQELFKSCFDHLRPGGVFIYIDVFRQTGQSREDYIDRYFDLVAQKWEALEAGEKTIVYDHVLAYDLPAVISDCLSWLQTIGFTLVQQFQPDERHIMLQWKR